MRQCPAWEAVSVLPFKNTKLPIYILFNALLWNKGFEEVGRFGEFCRHCPPFHEHPELK